MKAFIGILLFICCSSADISLFAQQKTGYIILSGQLKGFSNQAEVEDMSEYQYLLPPTSDRMIVPDANGKFTIKFKAAGPNYYRLGRNALYLSPGDNLEVFIDKGNPRLATFKGVGAAANIYLKNTPFPKGGSFLEAGRHVKESPAATIAAVEELAGLRAKELEALSDVTTEFRRLEAARIRADLINSIYSGETYGIYKLKLKDTAAKAYAEGYKKTIAPVVAQYSKNFTDPSMMKLVVYRDIAEELVKRGGKPADVQMIKDWYTASTLVRDMQKLSDKDQLRAFSTKIAAIKTADYKVASDKMLQRLMSFGKGDPAVDFTALDLAGNKVSLSSLKGKVIYVDLWATWCGPCMEEMPHFEVLKAKYKDNPDVVFVSLSIDDTDVPWKRSVESRNAQGYQWLINRSKLQAYNIVGIPRSLLIGKDFKIVDMDAPMPSQAAAVKAIDALLGKQFEYEIRGEIKGLNNDTLVFSVLGADGKNETFSAAGRNGQFSVKGSADRYAPVFASIGRKRSLGNFVFFLDRGIISIKGGVEDLAAVEVSGTPVNDDYARGEQMMDAFYKRRNVLYKKLAAVREKNGDTAKALNASIGLLMDSLLAFQMNSIKKDPASVFSAMQLYLIQDKISVVELEQFYGSLRTPAKELSILGALSARIKAKKTSELGKKASLFSINDVNGKLVNLIDFKGKYVLLDFWASWCVPCRKENPGLIRAYKKYRGKPFEIVSVSSDENGGNWKKAIKDDQVGDWIHVSDLKGLKNAIALQYGVQPIPDNFLIDPNGIIVGRNLFGEALERKLREVLN